VPVCSPWLLLIESSPMQVQAVERYIYIKSVKK
jgi:hypothetical protein